MLSRMAKSVKDPATSSLSRQTEGRFRMRIRQADAVAIGPGKIDLLEAVHEHGSISAAARSLGMSYRRAWLLIDELNRTLKAPATVSEAGGAAGGGGVRAPGGGKIIYF